MVKKTKTELKKEIRELEEEIKSMERYVKEEGNANKSLINAILNEAGVINPSCPICFRRFRDLDKYKEHLRRYREVKNGNRNKTNR